MRYKGNRRETDSRPDSVNDVATSQYSGRGGLVTVGSAVHPSVARCVT